MKSTYSIQKLFRHQCKAAVILLVASFLFACDSGSAIIHSPLSAATSPTAETNSIDGETPPTQSQLLSDSPTATNNRALKILPVGDSITQGYNSCSYRTPLAQSLQSNAVEFVGNWTRTPPTPGCIESNYEHEGRGGWRVIDWLEQDDQGSSPILKAVQAERPDIVLLHIGSNDMNRKELPGEFNTSTGKGSGTIGRIDTMIDSIYQGSPTAMVYVADLIPWLADDKVNKNLNNLRLEIEKLADYRTANGDQLRLVRMFEGFQPPMLQTDLIHPNSLGDSYLSSQWLNAMQADGFFLRTGNTAKIRVEAEHGTLTGNMSSGNDGIDYVSTSLASGYQTDYVTFEITIQDAGVYRILGRLKSIDHNNDALFFQLGSGEILKWTTPITEQYTTDYIANGQRLYIYLSAGTHIARVYNRRVNVRLDWLEFQYLGG